MNWILFMSGCRRNQPDVAMEDQATLTGSGSLIGDLRIHSFKSRVFGNERKLRILLPPDYESNTSKKYPVLYMNDGQCLFDSTTSIYNPLEWRLDELAAKLWNEDAVTPFIVVGIDNAGKRSENPDGYGRENEYLPYEDIYLHPPLPNPVGHLFPSFLCDEVMPFVNTRYRTKQGPENTGLGGASYGGLISLYVVIRRPGVFGRLLAESPSFYVSDARVLEEAEHIDQWPDRIYIGVGTHEGLDDPEDETGNPEAVQDVRRLESILRNRGFDDRNLIVVVEKGGMHYETDWARRLPAALKFFYAPEGSRGE